MDSNSRETFDSKAEFRKPPNDAANRKYRRRSPVGGSSSSSDGSPHRSSSPPVPSKKDTVRKDDDKNQSGRSVESHKHSDRQSSRNYIRHDDHSRRDRHVDVYDRYSKSSYRSGRGPRDNSLEYSRADKDHRSRDRGGYREDRGGRYGKSDHRKSSRDYKGDYEESRGQRNDSSSRRDGSGHRLKESSWRDAKEQVHSETKEQFDDISAKVEDSVTKKAKFSSSESAGPATDGTSMQNYVKDSDIDAAKIAAMKAAELVNKNLVGTGYMSTDQKKKLLWGNKKNTAAEETAHRWDTPMFGDRERQEKFNKLMGVKGEAKVVEQKQDNPDVEKQREQLQMDLEKQYTAGLRRRDGRTVGLGL